MRHSFQQHRPAQRHGLTRVEVVVVAALAVVTLAAVRPILLHARTAGPAAVCMVNLKALMQAWLLYAQDYNDEVVGSGTYDATAHDTAFTPDGTKRVWNWVGMPHDENGRSRNNTVEDELRGIRNGGLWGYLENESVYHCPADRRHYSLPTGAPWGLKGGYRTYSIGAVYNGWGFGGGWVTGEEYATVNKTTEIIDPADKIVFIEETDGYGYNVNTWNMFLNRKDIWGDPFAALHSSQTMFGYADGHAAPHRWQNQSTLDMAEAGDKQYPIPPDEKDDIDWFRGRYVPGNMPDKFKNI